MPDAPLLETKLHAPRRRSVVPRPRVAARLQQADAPPLTLVSAPAGFGKTTLLAEWTASASHDEVATAWLSLDAGDNDPAVFWSYVIAALRTAVPEAGATALPLLRSAQSPIDTVVTALLHDLSRLSIEVVLVLDDYHVIESHDLHEAVAFFLDHLPPHVHLVLGSRADPPFALGRMRARGDLLEIRAADLRFTADETATYLNQTMGLDITPSDIAVLDARTEGWIAALQLAALSMRDRSDVSGFIAGFAGDDRFIVDYLADEVLQRQTDDIRSFLLETSILSRLTGPLCRAVTGQADSKATLELLERSNLFLVPLDDRRTWYRYHQLFADVLRARLLDEAPDSVGGLHRRASDWYAENGDRAEAIGHAFAAEDVHRAAELIELAVPWIRRTRQEATMRTWLDALPDDMFPPRPVLTIARVGALMGAGETAGVELLLRSVERWIEPSQHAGASGAPIVVDRDEFARLRPQVAMYRAGLALLAGDVTATIAHAERVLDLSGPADHFGRGAASALTGLAYWSTGNLDAARRRYAEAVACFVDADFVPDVLGCSLALGDIQTAQGRLSDAVRTFETGLKHAAPYGALRGTADMHVGLGEVLIERNELGAAIAHLDLSDQLGGQAGSPQKAHRRLVALARIRQAEGDLATALDLLDDAERAYNTDYSPAVRPIPALKARVRLAGGDVDAALRWAADHRLSGDDELTYIHEFEHITLARTLLAHAKDRGDATALGEATALLDRLLAAAEEGDRAGSVIEILVLLAHAHHARGDLPAATSTLARAVDRAEPEGYVRVLVDTEPLIVPLLRTLPHGNQHLRRILAAANPSGPTRASTALVDELSSRELDVLRLLRSDLSGPDIARELLVSLNTLRTHTKNIYAKLGATSRRDAVRRAGELGL
ncbi:MAG: ATP-dependent transcriptional regulator, MalT-like, LuxR family [Acidimicrobiales bacterium]|nr:ATP-dependent transcriptional regulator, MalT-like, LuxR family [Acidimicrobiales bacterium]